VITSLWIENFKISNAIHKTGVVNEQRNPSRDPDRLIRWYVGVVVVGVVVNIISGFVLQQKWAWLPPAIFVAALLVTVPRSGLLRRERQGSTRWARGLAFIALAAYLAVAVWGSLTEWPTAVMILSVAFLWGAGSVLMWSTLRSQIQLGLVANGTSTLLLGSGVMLWGVAVRLEGSRMAGTILLIFGIAYLLSSVAVLLHRLALMEVGNLLHGTADYLAGGFFLGEGSLLLGEGSVFVGYGFVLLGVGELMSGIVGLLFVFESKVHRPVFESKVHRRADRMKWLVFLQSGIAVLVGVGLLGCGVLLLLDHLMVPGLIALLWGAGFLLFGIANYFSYSRFRPASVLVALPGISSSAAFFLLGAAFFERSRLVGVGCALVGIATLVGSVAISYRSEVPRRVLAWLTTRDDASES
jgi:hypothetical protein